jgi:hypothetical protein
VRGLEAEPPLARPDDPFWLCKAIPETYRPSCVFRAPQWWERVEPGLGYAEMGKRCREHFKEGRLHSICFGGIGFVAPIALNLSPERILDACQAATDNSQDFFYCVSIAANRVGAREQGAPQKICNALTDVKRAICLRASRGDLRIDSVR